MFRKIRNLFVRPKKKESITVEKLRQMLTYAERHGLMDISLPEETATGLGSFIEFHPTARMHTVRTASQGFEEGQDIMIPPQISWSNDSEFAYAGIIDDQIQLRYGTEANSLWYLCPIATHSSKKAIVENLFQSWYERLDLPGSLTSENRKVLPGAMISTSTTIRGFSMLSLQYPNHRDPAAGLTSERLAYRLAYAMDVEWFGTSEDMQHFAVTEPRAGKAGDIVGYGVEFGPYDEEADEFNTRHTVIIRETAGGGFMLLLQTEAEALYGKIITDLFQRAADGEITDPQVAR